MNLPTSRSAKIRGQINPNPPVLLTGYPVIDSSPQIQQAYEYMRRNGQSHNMAEMLAYRQAPASKTTDDFFRGMGTLDKQIGQDGPGETFYLDQVTGNYQRVMGHAPNPNHVYMAGLAQYPGDPRAFVANEGEAKRRAEELNVSVEGFVSHKAREPEVDPFGSVAMKHTKRAPVASDLKNLIKEQMVEQNPELKGRISDAALEAKHGNHVKER